MYFDCLGNEINKYDIIAISGYGYISEGVIKEIISNTRLQYYQLNEYGVRVLERENGIFNSKFNSKFNPSISTLMGFQTVRVIRLSEDMLNGDNLNYYKQMKKLLYGTSKNR